MGIVCKAAAFGNSHLGICRHQITILGCRVPAVKNHRLMGRDRQVAVGEGGGVFVPLILAKRLAVDCAAGGTVVRPLQCFDLLGAAPAVLLFKITAVGVPNYIVNRRRVGGSDGRILGGHGVGLFVPLDAHAGSGNLRLNNRCAEFHFAVGVGILSACNRVVAGVPRQSVAVSGVVELEHQVGGGAAACDIVYVLRVKGKAFKLGCRRRDCRTRLGALFLGRGEGVVVVINILLIGFNLILDRRSGILPRLPAQNGIAVRAVLPARAELLGKGLELRGGLLGRTVGRRGNRSIKIIAIRLCARCNSVLSI